MVAFLRWVRSIVVGTLNGVVMFALFLVLVFVALFAVGLAVGDGMPDKILLTLDLRSSLKDSGEASPLDIGEHPQRLWTSCSPSTRRAGMHA